PPGAIVPGDRPSGAEVTVAGYSVKAAVSPADDRGVRLAVFSPDSPLSLPEAVGFALENNPRLRAALAAIERARGQAEAAFAPFLPQIDLLTRYVATGKSTLPGAPGPTGVVNVTDIGTYSVWQGELQLQWTLYDFGRTAGRYRQADLREKIAGLQARRARETVAFDVAAAYLQALVEAAFRRI